MHAKVTVADDTTFLGSFNLSRSGETNAENVLEIARSELAERMADWIDGLRDALPAHLGWAPWTTTLTSSAGLRARGADLRARGRRPPRAVLRRVAQLVLLGPGGRVLDVGCGAGGALLPAARRVGPTGEAVGIDLAPGMVERARAAAERRGSSRSRPR